MSSQTFGKPATSRYQNWKHFVNFFFQLHSSTVCYYSGSHAWTTARRPKGLGNGTLRHRHIRTDMNVSRAWFTVFFFRFQNNVRVFYVANLKRFNDTRRAAGKTRSGFFPINDDRGDLDRGTGGLPGRANGLAGIREKTCARNGAERRWIRPRIRLYTRPSDLGRYGNNRKHHSFGTKEPDSSRRTLLADGGPRVQPSAVCVHMNKKTRIQYEMDMVTLTRKCGVWLGRIENT